MEALCAKTARLHTQYGRQYWSEFQTTLQTIRRKYNYSYIDSSRCSWTTKECRAPARGVANAVAEQYSTLAQYFLQGTAFDNISEKDGKANAASYSKDTPSTKASDKCRGCQKDTRTRRRTRRRKRRKVKRKGEAQEPAQNQAQVPSLISNIYATLPIVSADTPTRISTNTANYLSDAN